MFLLLCKMTYLVQRVHSSLSGRPWTHLTLICGSSQTCWCHRQNRTFTSLLNDEYSSFLNKFLQLVDRSLSVPHFWFLVTKQLVVFFYSRDAQKTWLRFDPTGPAAKSPETRDASTPAVCVSLHPIVSCIGHKPRNKTGTFQEILIETTFVKTNRKVGHLSMDY